MKLIVDNKNSVPPKSSRFVLSIDIMLIEGEDSSQNHQYEFFLNDEESISIIPRLLFALECVRSFRCNNSEEYVLIPEYQAFFLDTDDRTISRKIYEELNPIGFFFDSIGNLHYVGFLEDYELVFYCDKGRMFPINIQFNDQENKRFSEIRKINYKEWL
jgi:hypothetical protein